MNIFFGLYLTIALLSVCPGFLWAQVKTDLFYTHDYISNTGGLKAGPRNIGAIDIYFETDFSQYSSVPGRMQLHYNHIGPNDQRGAIGDLQYASNIDMPAQVDRIVDFYYEHEFSEKFQALIGIHDICMEFNVTESSLNFLNSSFGVNAEFAYSGVNGPSLYPLTSLGARTLYQFSEELSLRTGIYDADPGGTKTYRSFHSDIGWREGFMHLSELAFQTDDQKWAIAGWNYSRAQEKIGTNLSATAYGSYLIMEKEMSEKINIFLRYGWANPLANQIQSNSAAGMTYSGILQKKKDLDEIGLGVSQAHFSRPFMKELHPAEDFYSNETAYETYYHFTPMEHLSLRPDVQYITNPAGSRVLRNAWAMGFRTVINL